MIRLTGVNTLVFRDELEKSSIQQWVYFAILSKMGAPFVEVRREYLRDFDEELQKTNQEASKLGLALLYSVPSSLFVGDKINPELDQFFSEAKAMGAIQIKLTMGPYTGFTEETASEVQAVLKRYPSIRLSIENDQSQAGGSIQALENFMADVNNHNLKISLTFDTGNFIYIGEDPDEAAVKLAEHVNYIHIKNVKKNDDGSIEMTLFEEGMIPILDVIKKIDEQERVIAAIEYPCGPTAEALQTLLKEYRLITRK